MYMHYVAPYRNYSWMGPTGKVIRIGGVMTYLFSLGEELV